MSDPITSLLDIVADRAARDPEVIGAVRDGDPEALRNILPRLMQEELASQLKACERIEQRTERGRSEMSALIRGIWTEIRTRQSLTAKGLTVHA